MSRSKLWPFVSHAVLALSLVGSGVAIAAEAEATLGETEAVQSKLATKALLLDVKRTGNRIVAVGEYGNVILSDDQGKTWRQAKHVPTQVTLTAVTFADEKNGWAVGHDTLILHTVDGGETWTKQFGGGLSDNALLTVAFWDTNHGLALGAFNFTVETKDGGKTWTERKTLNPVQAPAPTAAAPAGPAGGSTDSEDPYAAATGDENHLNSALIGPDGTIVVAAEAGVVFRSADQGVTWTKIQTGYNGSFWGGLWAKDGSVYVSGMRGNIWHSTDKGVTWAKVDTDGADQSIASGVQLADGSFVFVGLGGQVLYSADGKTFTLNYRDDRKGLNAVIEDGADRLLLFGESGVVEQASKPGPSQAPAPVLPPAG